MAIVVIIVIKIGNMSACYPPAIDGWLLHVSKIRILIPVKKWKSMTSKVNELEAHFYIVVFLDI